MSIEPAIYTRNYIDDHSVIVVSTDDADKALAFDRDKDSVWKTSGENSDATESSYDATFYEAGGAVSRTIDTIIVLNHNLKAPTFEYWDGAAWQTLYAASGLAVANSIFTFNSVSVGRVRMRCSTTQTTNQEKYMGEFVVCARQITFTQEISSYDVSHPEKAVEFPLADGSTHRSIILWSQNRSDKYGARMRFDYLTATELETMRRLKIAGQAFLWQPESTARPDQLYLVYWVGQFQYKYVTTYKGAGLQLNAEFREV